MKENELMCTYSKQLQFLVNPDWIEKDVSTQTKGKVILRFGAAVKFPAKPGGAHYIAARLVTMCAGSKVAENSFAALAIYLFLMDTENCTGPWDAVILY